MLTSGAAAGGSLAAAWPHAIVNISELRRESSDLAWSDLRVQNPRFHLCIDGK